MSLKDTDVRTPGDKEIAKKFKLSLAKVRELVKQGAEHEKEHNTNLEKAKEVARDHIAERPDYYKMLKKAEKTDKNIMKENTVAHVRGLGFVSGDPAAGVDYVDQYKGTNMMSYDDDNGNKLKYIQQAHIDHHNQALGYNHFNPTSIPSHSNNSFRSNTALKESTTTYGGMGGSHSPSDEGDKYLENNNKNIDKDAKVRDKHADDNHHKHHIDLGFNAFRHNNIKGHINQALKEAKLNELGGSGEPEAYNGLTDSRAARKDVQVDEGEKLDKAKKVAMAGLTAANLYTAGDVMSRAAEGRGGTKGDVVRAASTLPGAAGWAATGVHYAKKAYDIVKNKSKGKLNEAVSKAKPKAKKPVAKAPAKPEGGSSYNEVMGRVYERATVLGVHASTAASKSKDKEYLAKIAELQKRQAADLKLLPAKVRESALKSAGNSVTAYLKSLKENHGVDPKEITEVHHTNKGIDHLIGRNVLQRDNPHDLVVRIGKGKESRLHGASLKKTQGTLGNNSHVQFSSHGKEVGIGHETANIWHAGLEKAGLKGLSKAELKLRQKDKDVMDAYKTTQQEAIKHHTESFNSASSEMQRKHLRHLMKLNHDADVPYDYVNGEKGYAKPVDQLDHAKAVNSSSRFAAVSRGTSTHIYDDKGRHILTVEHRATHGPFNSMQANAKLGSLKPPKGEEVKMTQEPSHPMAHKEASQEASAVKPEKVKKLLGQVREKRTLASKAGELRKAASPASSPIASMPKPGIKQAPKPPAPNYSKLATDVSKSVQNISKMFAPRPMNEQGPVMSRYTERPTYEGNDKYPDTAERGIYEMGWASIGHPFTRRGDVNPEAKFYGKKPKPTTTKNDEKDDTYNNSKQGDTKVKFAKTVKEEKKMSLRQHLKQRFAQDPDGIGVMASRVSAPPKPKTEPKKPVKEEQINELHGKGSLEKIRSHHQGEANKLAQGGRAQEKKMGVTGHRHRDSDARTDAIRYHMDKVKKAKSLQSKTVKEEQIDELVATAVPPTIQPTQTQIQRPAAQQVRGSIAQGQTKIPVRSIAPTSRTSGAGTARLSQGGQSGGGYNTLKPTTTDVKRNISNRFNPSFGQQGTGSMKASSIKTGSSFSQGGGQVAQKMSSSSPSQMVAKMSDAGRQAMSAVSKAAPTASKVAGIAARALGGPAATAAAAVMTPTPAGAGENEKQRQDTLKSYNPYKAQGRSVSDYEKQVMTPKASEAPKVSNPKVDAPTPPSRPDYFSRGQAFQAARGEAGGGEGKFSYDSKSYQTNVSGEKYKPAAQLKPTSVQEAGSQDKDWDETQTPFREQVSLNKQDIKLQQASYSGAGGTQRTVHEETKMDNKLINEAIENIMEDNLSAMKENLMVALQEKAIEKLEERKKDIASQYFAQ